MSDHELVPYGQVKVDPTVEVHRLQMDDEISELRYQLKRIEADLERFITGTVKKMEASKIMLERRIAALLMEKDKLDRFGSQEVIDVTNIEKGGQNG